MDEKIEKIKLFYEKHIYKIGHIKKLLENGKITEEEYNEIVGEEYNS